MSNDSRKLIRNSTTEFLIFTGQAGEQSIEARHEDETVWLTQKDYFERLRGKIHERRFSRSLVNLLNVFSHKFDRCTCIMNNGEKPIPMFEQKGDSRDILHDVYYQQLIKSIAE